jgi:hypothetical protein
LAYRALAVIGPPANGPILVLADDPVETYFISTYTATLARQEGASFELDNGVFRVGPTYTLADALAEPQVAPGHPIRVVVTTDASAEVIDDIRRQRPELAIEVFRI